MVDLTVFCINFYRPADAPSDGELLIELMLLWLLLCFNNVILILVCHDLF